ncbi:MAG: tRNA preQ1(34) S-adenosylmethionine ribosyltransferase-isomerase QueA [Clostridiales bacterium]|nr:tRNA preQ1(34) S-adenosylmethionine ribosyltransferase-isomerase QueA [Clostridiales bacterium]
MKKSDFFYELPERLIAQHPLEHRDTSRMMLLERDTDKIQHKSFYELPDFLNEGDCLVLNDTRVLPARLYGTKDDTGARVEFLLLEPRENDVWEVITGPGKRARQGSHFTFADGVLRAEVLEVLDNGNRVARFTYDGSNFYEVLDRIGQMPLPHYITEELKDKERYQTVYSKQPGSAAAPTAGLHFTQELLEKIRSKGVNIVYVTLHVGLGTFRPVKTDDIEKHHMHSEHYFLPEKTALAINEAKANGKRVIAVGTTSCRTLESVASFRGCICEDEGYTDIFIYPGYKFKCIDGLITNFHLPESTLIMLVSAFYGYDKTMLAYKTAVEREYRFFSFGDSMAIL